MNAADIKDLIDDWIPDLDVQPVPCPRCGHLPRLVAGDPDSHPDTWVFKYECRKWLRLFRCAVGPSAADEDERYARAKAAIAWNRKMAEYDLLTKGCA